MNEPPPKKEKLNIKKIINHIKESDLKTKKEKEGYLKKYKYMKMDYTFLYNLIVNNDLEDNKNKEVNILNTMMEQINNIEEKKVSKENGEKKIGELLVDTYVKPVMKN